MDVDTTLIGFAIGILVVGLLIGFLIGRIGRSGLKERNENLFTALKASKADADSKEASNGKLYLRYIHAISTAERLHDQSHCPNKDTWEDHTASQPYGLTPEVKEQKRIEKEEKRRREAELSLARENARKDSEARKKAQRDHTGGFTSTDGSWVAVVASSFSSDSSSDSCDGGGGGGGE